MKLKILQSFHGQIKYLYVIGFSLFNLNYLISLSIQPAFQAEFNTFTKIDCSVLFYISGSMAVKKQINIFEFRFFFISKKDMGKQNLY